MSPTHLEKFANIPKLLLLDISHQVGKPGSSGESCGAAGERHPIPHHTIRAR